MYIVHVDTHTVLSTCIYIAFITCTCIICLPVNKAIRTCTSDNGIDDLKLAVLSLSRTVPQTKVLSSSASDHSHSATTDTSSGRRQLAGREGEEEVVIASGQTRGERPVKRGAVRGERGESMEEEEEEEEEYEEGDFSEYRLAISLLQTCICMYIRV